MNVTVEIPLTLPSAGNMREHPMARHRRIKAQRAATHLSLLAHRVGHRLVVVNGQRLGVTLTRVAPRKLDDDNLAFAFKGIRDEVAAYFGVDDADPRVVWRYGQAKGKPAMVRIEFEAFTENGEVR